MDGFRILNVGRDGGIKGLTTFQLPVNSKQLSVYGFFCVLRTCKSNSGLKVALLEGICVLWDVCKIEAGIRLK